jgi:hypothetical protein
MIASGVLFNTSHILCCLLADQVTQQFDGLQEYCLKLEDHRRHLILPHLQGDNWANHLPHVHNLATLPACCMFAETSAINSQALSDLLVVESRPIPGVLATAELPETIWCLPRSSEQAKLSFIFAGRLAGLPTSVLWNGGASTSFVDSHLVAQLSLSL